MIPRHGKVRMTIAQLREYVNSPINEGDEDLDIKDEDSLDVQVDSYLTQYESEAKKSKTEGRDFRTLVKRFLTEEEGDDVPSIDAKDQSGDKKGIDEFDVGSYVSSVIRLIENYDSLIEVRSTLARRARNFIAKQYDSNVLQRFDSIIRQEHGIVPGKTHDDVEREESSPPYAANASGPSPAGATG